MKGTLFVTFKYVILLKKNLPMNPSQMFILYKFTTNSPTILKMPFLVTQLSHGFQDIRWSNKMINIRLKKNSIN